MSETTENKSVLKPGRLDIIKYRWVFLGISAVFLIPGLIFIVMNMMNPDIQAPVRLGIDFRGGTLLEYGFTKPVTQQDLPVIRDVFAENGYTGSVVQIQQPRVGINQKAVEVGNTQKPSAQGAIQGSEKAVPAPETTSVEAAQAAHPEIKTIVSVRSKHLQGDADVKIQQALESRFGHIVVLQKNSMGPSMAKELLTNGLIALLLAYLLIVGYLSFRFQFDFAVCAIAALVHDTLFLIGVFAIIGHFFHTEVDSLFITAVLTAIGFSVHDTIVVFDRVRENSRIYFTKKIPFGVIVNASVNQTLARSINTSLTALLPLIALYFFGGETTRDFVFAILVGIAAGTYSSIFNASVLLAMWRSRQSGPTPAVA